LELVKKVRQKAALRATEIVGSLVMRKLSGNSNEIVIGQGAVRAKGP
jgi:hypothetical protein